MQPDPLPILNDMSADSSTAQPRPKPRSWRQLLLFGMGLVLLIVCAAASGMLACHHLTGMAIPGCGAESPCAKAT